MRNERSFLSVLLVLGAAVIAAAAAWLAPEAANDLMRENGPIENATVVVYLVGVLAAWTVRHPAFGKTSAAAVSVLLIVCVAREIGLRRQLLAAAGYDPSSASLSAWPNLLAGAIAVALPPAALWLVWRYWRGALQGLVRRKPFAVTLLVAFLALVVAELFDHLLKQSGTALDTTQWRAVAFSLEETLEMMFPILLMIAAWQTGVSWRDPARRAP